MTFRPGQERRVFVDTSAYLALLARNDQYHDDARAILRVLLSERIRQVTTNNVVIESHALVMSTLGVQAGQRFLRSMENGNTTIIRSRGADEARGREIIYQYSDKDFSLTDAISFAVMERLGIRRAFTFDRHFAQFGFEGDWPSTSQQNGK